MGIGRLTCLWKKPQCFGLTNSCMSAFTSDRRYGDAAEDGT
jgi:hypothetical protein